MKFTLMSDLHLEFPDHEPIEFPEADVLVLAGDILVAEDLRRQNVTAQRYREFLDQCSSSYQHVVYVAGNHEFYHGKFAQTLEVLRSEALQYSNVHFLEDEYVDVADVRFLGATLWTDCNNHDPVTQYHLQAVMNDYRVITNDEKGYTKLRPAHTQQRHVKSKQFIQKHCTPNTVVVTHHAPSFQSVPDKYQDQQYENAAYASNLHEFVLDLQPEFWLHGHMHDVVDYQIGETHVVANPRGYPRQNPGWQPRTFEI